MKLSIIIPVYNEEQTIGEVIERVWMVDLGDLDREVIIANDGSSDGTQRVIDASRWINDPRVKTYNSPINLGKGAAVRLGLGFATGDILLVQDADLELDPAQLKDLVQPILHGEADAVYGSRFLVRSFKVPLITRIGNKTLTWMTNVLFGQSLTDMETCYKIIRGDIARALDLKADRFDIEPEITVALLRGGHKIVELPVTFSPRSRAAGKKMRWRDGIEAIRMLWRHRRG